jgi:hypothetical protein
MATLMSTVGRTIHRTANSLLENDVPTKIADAIASAAKSGMSVVEEAVKVVRDVTEPEAETPPPDNDGP